MISNVEYQKVKYQRVEYRKFEYQKVEYRKVEYWKVEIWKSRINKVSDTTYISDVAFFKIVNNLISVCVGFWFSNFDCHFFAAGTINLSKGGSHWRNTEKVLKKQKKTFKCQFSMYVCRPEKWNVSFFPHIVKNFPKGACQEKKWLFLGICPNTVGGSPESQNFTSRKL